MITLLKGGWVAVWDQVVDVSLNGRFAPSQEFAENASLFMWPTLTLEDERPVLPGADAQDWYHDGG